jgi:hypothetical protein
MQGVLQKVREFAGVQYLGRFTFATCRYKSG